MGRGRRTLTIGALLAITLAMSAPAAAQATGTFKLPPVRHVFVITLENQSYASTFGNPSADPYLAQVLPGAGALLQNLPAA
jgi:phosphatidylinositol-3-phosphatase